MGFSIAVRRSGSGGLFVEGNLNGGVYPAVITNIKEDTKQKYLSEEMEDCLTFFFDIPEHKAKARYQVTPSVCVKPNKSNLIKILEALNPGCITSGVLNTDQGVYDTLEALVGRKCMIQISAEEKDGTIRRKVTQVLGAIQGGGKQAQPAQQAPGLVEVPFEDDDIPF